MAFKTINCENKTTSCSYTELATVLFLQQCNSGAVRTEATEPFNSLEPHACSVLCFFLNDCYYLFARRL